MNILDLISNKRVGFIGFGKSNTNLAKYLLKYTDKIFFSEIEPENKIKNYLEQLGNNVEYECTKHSEKLLQNDIIIKAPGVSENIEIIKKIKEKKIPILTEIEVSYQLLENKLEKLPFIIAITGTNGKTTTTTLTGEILKKFFGENVFVAGNIGKPLIDHVDEIKGNSKLVLEVSSYQLEDIVKFKPNIACLLNITSDHLEHHQSMQRYIDAKSRIFINQDESCYAILNYDDLNIRKINFHKYNTQVFYFSTKTRLVEGIYYNTKKKKFIFTDTNHKEIILEPKVNILGLHNIENIMASICCSIFSGVDKKTIEEVISEFNGVEHRLEFVRDINGIKFINDSKATNVDSTLVALKSFDSKKAIHLILGGRDKGAPYDPLLPLIKEKVKYIFLIGEASDIIYSQLKVADVEIFKCNFLQKAVQESFSRAEKGDIILFSPACSSFDQFMNFEHRGKEFKKIIASI